MYPSKTYSTVLKNGMANHSVWAFQLNLKRKYDIVSDGVFGDATESIVRRFQTLKNLKVDGVAGIVTQRALALELIERTEGQFRTIPIGMLKGISEGESGWAVGAVNWSVGGGVDCGWMQRRVYFADDSDAMFAQAFDGYTQFVRFAKECQDLHDQFRRIGYVSDKRAWQLVILNHNWPAGADTLARGRTLSTSYASWVANIGVPGVTTPAQWADSYINSKDMYIEDWTR
jgi:hypothetical protein